MKPEVRLRLLLAKKRLAKGRLSDRRVSRTFRISFYYSNIIQYWWDC